MQLKKPDQIRALRLPQFYNLTSHYKTFGCLFIRTNGIFKHATMSSRVSLYNDPLRSSHLWRKAVSSADRYKGIYRACSILGDVGFHFEGYFSGILQSDTFHGLLNNFKQPRFIFSNFSFLAKSLGCLQSQKS